jgi:hypothetical protein
MALASSSNTAPIDARNGRGPLGSVNALSLQHHDESGRSVTADRGWKRRFEHPIPLPCGRYLVALEYAGSYTTKLQKAEHQARERQAAMEALISGACQSASFLKR